VILQQVLGCITPSDLAAYCYIQSSVVSLSVSVCLSVMFVSPAKMVELIKMLFGVNMLVY